MLTRPGIADFQLLIFMLALVYLLLIESAGYSSTRYGERLFSDSLVNCYTPLTGKTAKIYQEGLDFFNRSNFPMASMRMKQVLQADAESIEAMYTLGVINFRQRNSNFKEAERYLLKVMEKCPGYNVYACYYLAEINYGKENYEKATEYLNCFLSDVDKIKSDEDYNRAMELLKYSKFVSGLISKPVPFDPKVVEGISTQMNEYLPSLSPDNHLAFFTREIRLEPDRNSLTPEVRYKERFFYSVRDSAGNYLQGEEMEDPFNMESNEGGATLTADNNTLYYTVCKFDAARNYLNCDLYMTENSGGYWQSIRNAGSAINGSESWESQPSVTPDGRILYFVSDRPGGFGGYDLYKSVKGDNGEWGGAVNLGADINTRGNEKTPFIHPDGKTLYFSSDGLQGLGGYDIFITRLQEDGSWQKPVNIGFPINSVEDEAGFFVSTDGSKGFFASNKYNGKGGWDLYSFELYEGARPEKVLFIRGNVKSENADEPVRAKIELKNLETRKISEIPMDTITGNYVAVAPFNSDYIMTVKKTDHVYESRYISQVDSGFRLPVTMDVEMKPIEINQSYKINDIRFATNDFTLNAESKAIIDQLTEFLKENPNVSIQIQGHTDNVGSDVSNLKLSESRAESVYKYLVEQGISESRLTYKGFGKNMPVASNDTEEGRARNRRTVFVITHK